MMASRIVLCALGASGRPEGEARVANGLNFQRSPFGLEDCSRAAFSHWGAARGAASPKFPV
jgi:hypothetical protein